METAEIKCPYCRLPTVWAGNDSRPFCSERCRLLDLGAWAGEDYRISAEPLPEAGEDVNYSA